MLYLSSNYKKKKKNSIVQINEHKNIGGLKERKERRQKKNLEKRLKIYCYEFFEKRKENIIR